MVGYHKVPVPGVDRGRRRLHRELVHAVGEVGLEVAHLLGRLHRIGASRRCVEGEHLRAGELREPDRLPSYVLGISRMVVLDIRRGRGRMALSSILGRWTAFSKRSKSLL